MPGRPRLTSISLQLSKSSGASSRKGKAPSSSFHSFVDQYRKISSDKSFSAIKPVWDDLKSRAGQLGISDDQIKGFQTQIPVNKKIKVFVPSSKDRQTLFAIVSVDSKGQTKIDTRYKRPADRGNPVGNLGAYAQLSSLLRKNASVSVQDFNQIWKQVVSNLEQGVTPSDLVVREEGSKIRIYAPSKKGVLKVVETLNLKVKK